MDYKYKFEKYYYKFHRLLKQKGGMAIQTKNMQNANIIFTINLFDSLDGASNLISPISICLALGLLQLGAKGTTDMELTRLLLHKYNLDELKYLYQHFNNDVIRMENIFIINNKIKINQEYLDLVGKGLDPGCIKCPNTKNIPLATIIHKNFEDAALIAHKVNNHVEENTDGMIKAVVNPQQFSPDVPFVLVNTVYFKASWMNKFDVNKTTKMPFHRTNLVDMMHQINHFNYYENSAVQLVEMLYDEKPYAMGIILPRKYLDEEGVDYSVNNVPQFSPNEINEMINNMQYTKVDLYVPKFKQRKKIDLVPILKKLEVKTLFEAEAELDMIGQNISVSGITHEVVIIVDENGTKAAATTVAIGEVSAPRPVEEEIKLFKADHAFIFYVRHVNSNLFLFYGDFQNSPTQ